MVRKNKYGGKKNNNSHLYTVSNSKELSIRFLAPCFYANICGTPEGFGLETDKRTISKDNGDNWENLQGAKTCQFFSTIIIGWKYSYTYYIHIYIYFYVYNLRSSAYLTLRIKYNFAVIKYIILLYVQFKIKNSRYFNIYLII